MNEGAGGADVPQALFYICNQPVYNIAIKSEGLKKRRKTLWMIMKL